MKQKILKRNLIRYPKKMIKHLKRKTSNHLPKNKKNTDNLTEHNNQVLKIPHPNLKIQTLLQLNYNLQRPRT